MNDKASIAYLTVFGVLALASWYFARKLSPERKHALLPRFAVTSVLLLAPFFVVPALIDGNFTFAILASLALAFIGYVNVVKVRVCKACGVIAQPEKLLVAANFCPKCGAKLEQSSLFRKGQV